LDILGEVFYFTLKKSKRIVEAYVGEYASGKSEMAINRAIELKNWGHKVTLVDLDTVEPFYTLRPLVKILETKDINVIAFSKDNSFGLGETGAMLNPKAKWSLMHEGDVILDIGYGVNGARTLNLVEGANESPELRVIIVVNYARPMTNSKEKVKEYIENLGRVDAVVANTHLGDETTLALIKKGNSIIIQAAREMGIPVDYMAINENMKEVVIAEEFNVPVKFINRYMPGAIW